MKNLIKSIAEANNISEKTVAEIMKAGFFLGRDCPDFNVAQEIGDEFDTYIYKK